MIEHSHNKEVTAIILKGGRSRRMGKDKALLSIYGEPMIARIKEALSPVASAFILSVAVDDSMCWPGMTTVPDMEAEMGPLMGIRSALAASRTDLNVIAACDIPVIHKELVPTLLSYASGAEIVLPAFGSRRPEPLLGVYRKRVAETAERLLETGARRVSALLDVCKTKIVPIERSDWYFNLNTKAEYEYWRRRADGSGNRNS